MTSPKDLLKLAAICRKAGIKTFKQGDLEFTLEDRPAPPKRVRNRKAASAPVDPAADLAPDHSMSYDQLLYYSVTNESAEDEAAS